MRVCSFPFIIRITTEKNSTEALSLSASTWSLATIFSGLMISGLDWVSQTKLLNNRLLIDEYSILWVITILGMFSYFFANRIEEDIASRGSRKSGIFSLHKNYDWKLILILSHTFSIKFLKFLYLHTI